MAYVITLIDEEEGVYGASFPDFPGATTVAEDMDTLYRNAVEVLTLHVEGMIEDNEEVPEPRTLQELRRDPKFIERSADAAVGVVQMDLPGRAVRVNVSFEEGLLKRLDRAAKAVGESRSGFLAKAAKARLAESV